MLTQAILQIYQDPILLYSSLEILFGLKNREYMFHITQVALTLPIWTGNDGTEKEMPTLKRIRIQQLQTKYYSKDWRRFGQWIFASSLPLTLEDRNQVFLEFTLEEAYMWGIWVSLKSIRIKFHG